MVVMGRRVKGRGRNGGRGRERSRRGSEENFRRGRKRRMGREGWRVREGISQYGRGKEKTGGKDEKDGR